MLKIVNNVSIAISKRTEEDLKDAIDMSAELPHGGGHLQIVKQAKILILRIQEEKRIVKLLENAILSNDINSLKSALSAQAAVQPPFYTPLVEQAKELIAKLERETAVRNGLLAAIAARSLSQLNEFIEKAHVMGIVSNELHQAEVLKVRIDQENQLLSDLTVATNKKDLDVLLKLISQCLEMGLDRPELAAAQKMKEKMFSEQAELRAAAERQRLADEAAALKRLQVIEDAKKRLIDVRQSKDVSVINQALETAMQLGEKNILSSKILVIIYYC